MTALSRTNLSSLWHRARDFFTRRIWDTRIDELPRLRALGYRAARIVYCALRGLLWSDRLHVWAAALTYYTVLSVVPLLAFAFAVLKGFGAYDMLVQDTVRPYLLETFAGNPSLRSAFEHVLDFVAETNVASLGFVGLLIVLYTATRLLRNIEGALNELWEARRGRSPFEQLRDYVAIIVVTPLCLILAAGVATFSQLMDLLRSVQETLGLGGLLEWSVGSFGPLVVAFIGLLFLYKLMPNTRVRARSALVGAALGAVLWYAALVLHVRFQVGVARFNALYSGFGAIPIFLVWLDVSWLVVMVGAEVAASHQHEPENIQRRRAAETGHALREALCVSAMLRIARALIEGDNPPSLSALSRELDVPQQLVRDLLRHMVDAELLRRTGPEDDPQWMLARLPEQVRVKDLLDALHGTAPWQRDAIEGREGVEAVAVQLLRRLDRDLDRSNNNRSLRELLARDDSERP